MTNISQIMTSNVARKVTIARVSVTHLAGIIEHKGNCFYCVYALNGLTRERVLSDWKECRNDFLPYNGEYGYSDCFENHGFQLTFEENDREGYNFYLVSLDGSQSSSLEHAIETGLDSSLEKEINCNAITWACFEADKIDSEGDWVDYYSDLNDPQ